MNDLENTAGLFSTVFELVRFVFFHLDLQQPPMAHTRPELGSHANMKSSSRTEGQVGSSIKAYLQMV